MRVKIYPNVEVLKVAIEAAWADLDPDVICAACGAAKKRLNAIVAAKGSYIE